MEAAPALPAASSAPIDIASASSAELVSHVSKSKKKTKKKKKQKDKNKYIRTETPELLQAISSILETQDFLIHDAAALKKVLCKKFPDMIPTYSIVKKIAARLLEKQRADRGAEAATRTKAVTQDCEALRAAIKSILSGAIGIDTTTLKKKLLEPPHFIQIKWKLLEDVFSKMRVEFELATEQSAPKICRQTSGSHKLQRARSVSGMDWSKVTGLSASTTGSVGVLFVQFTDGVVVLKSSDKNFSETLGMVLSSQLGIPTVECRVMYLKPEGKRVEQCLKDFVDEYPERMEEPLRIRDRITKVFSRPQVLVLQLVTGAISLDELQSLHTKPQLLASQHGARVDKEVLLAAPAKVFDAALAPGRRRLRELGQILALDVFTNNCDRVPTVFDNAGNPGNVLFSYGAATDRAQVVAVDQDVTAVDPHSKAGMVQENLAGILSRATAFVTEVMACCTAHDEGVAINATKQLKVLDSVRRYITPFTLHDFGKEGLHALAEGARDTIHKLCALTDSYITALLAKVLSMSPVVTSPMWIKMSEAPFRPFFTRMREAFRRGMTTSDSKGDVKT